MRTIRFAYVTLFTAIFIAGLMGSASAQSNDEMKKLAQGINALYKAGQYAEAIPHAEQYARLIQRSFGDEHVERAAALHTLALLYNFTGRLSEAEASAKLSLQIREKLFGPNHSTVVASLHASGFIATTQGRHEVSAHAYQRILRIAPNDPDAVEGLGRSLFALGRYREAEPAYRQALALMEKVRGQDHLDVARTLSGLAILHWVLGRFADVEALHRRALSIREKQLGHDHKDLAKDLHFLGAHYHYMGRYQEAQQLIKRSLDINEKAVGNRSSEFALSLIVLADIYRDLGRHDDAEPLVFRAIAIFENGPSAHPPLLAVSILQLAAIRQVQKRNADAETLLHRGIDLTKASLGSSHPNLAIAYNSLAHFLDEQGRVDEAKVFLEKVLEIAERTVGRDHYQALWSRVSLALREAEANSDLDIEPLIESARAAAESRMGTTHPALIGAAARVGRTYIVRQEWPLAYRYLKRASEIAEGRERYFDEGTMQSRTSDNWNWFSAPYASAIRAAYRLELGSHHSALTDEVFRFSQLAVQTAASRALGQMAARFASGSGPLSKLVRERQDLVRQRAALERRLFSQKTDASSLPQAISAEDVRSELLAIEVQLAALDGHLKREFPQFADFVNPQPLTIAEVQAQLRSEEVLVQFVEAPKIADLPSEVFVWVINQQQWRWARIDLDTQSIYGLVRALRCGLDETQWVALTPEGTFQCQQLLGLKSQPSTGQPLPFDLRKSHALYRALLGPFEDLIKGRHILVVPSGTLASLPFQVLVTEVPDGLVGDYAAYGRAKWLVAGQPITVLPSVASLKGLRQFAGASLAKRPYAGFGNPLLDGNPYRLADREHAKAARDRQSCPATPARVAILQPRIPLKPLARGGVADVTQIKRLQPLPETTDELCSVAASLSALPSDVRLGALATETEIKALSANGQLAFYRILHFATHGALSGEVEGNAEPGLVLTPPASASDLDDGYLTASEIATLKIDADWVILSACNTAAAGSANAELLSGMARAFFYAGARSLLVSHWAVNSDATVELITKTFAALRGDPRIGRAEALRRSMMALISKGDAYAHPANWAPFVLVGEGQGSASAAKAGPTNLRAQKSARPPAPDWRLEIFGR